MHTKSELLTLQLNSLISMYSTILVHVNVFCFIFYLLYFCISLFSCLLSTYQFEWTSVKIHGYLNLLI